MNEWAGFWAIMIVVSLATFAVLSVVVAIGGWRDLKELLDRTDESERSSEDDV